MKKGQYVESNFYGYGVLKEDQTGTEIKVFWFRSRTVFNISAILVEKADVIACKYCGDVTPMLGTKLCDPCYELSTRLRMQLQTDHEVVRKMLADESPKFSLTWDCTLGESMAYESRMKEKPRP